MSSDEDEDDVHAINAPYVWPIVFHLGIGRLEIDCTAPDLGAPPDFGGLVHGLQDLTLCWPHHVAVGPHPNMVAGLAALLEAVQDTLQTLTIRGPIPFGPPLLAPDWVFSQLRILTIHEGTGLDFPATMFPVVMSVNIRRHADPQLDMSVLPACRILEIENVQAACTLENMVNVTTVFIGESPGLRVAGLAPSVTSISLTQVSAAQLPLVFSDFPNIKEFVLVGADILALPAIGERDLRHLSILRLVDCGVLRQLPPPVLELPTLQLLTLDDCPQLEMPTVLYRALQRHIPAVLYHSVQTEGDAIGRIQAERARQFWHEKHIHPRLSPGAHTAIFAAVLSVQNFGRRSPTDRRLALPVELVTRILRFLTIGDVER